ncbi:MAG: carbohydrate kinase [Bacteroidales bacterium]|nr:carbohydrate kinase [Bacteroidales bacterium]
MIYTIGETVIDLIFKNMQPQAAKVGGSALNTSVSLGRLGNQVSFISEIGADEFGAWCTQFLAENGVDTAHLVQYSDKKTSLAIAFLNEQNDAHYQFYKEFTEPMPSASVNFNSSDILLFSSSFALNKRVRQCVANILQIANSQDVLVYYDPNMRKSLRNQPEAKVLLEENFKFADIVHISDEDAFALFETNDIDAICDEMWKYSVKVLIFTRNKYDVVVCTQKERLTYLVPKITTVSTIGAGDTFNAGVLHNLNCQSITPKNIGSLMQDFWNEAIPFAISCAGNVCQSIDNYIDKSFARQIVKK